MSPLMDESEMSAITGTRDTLVCSVIIDQVRGRNVAASVSSE